MDFESLERCWRENADGPLPRLEEATLMRLIEDRAASVRGDVRRRLRRETAYYLPLMALAGASLLAGFTLNRVVAASCVLMLLGGVTATLWQAERRLEDTRVLAVAWSVQSGRAYVERMFRRYRAELGDCLRQLEG